VEAGADLQEGTDPAPHDDLALGRVGNAGEDLEEGALAGAVPADDAEHLTALDLEVDILEGPEGVLRCPEVLKGSDGVPDAGSDTFREGFVGFIHPDLVLLGEVLHLNNWFVFICCHLDQIREVFLCMTEVQDAAEKDHKRHHGRDGEAEIVHRHMPEQDGPVCIDEAGHGIQGEYPLQVPAEHICRVDHRRDKHQELDKERKHELHIPVLHADGREPVAGPCREEQGEEDYDRQQEDLGRRHELVIYHHPGEDRHSNHIVHDARETRRCWYEDPWHIDFRK